MGNFLNYLHPLLKRVRGSNENDNYAVVNALHTALEDSETDMVSLKLESSLKTSSGSYLDKWGNWFGVLRKEGESDEDYRARIIGKLLLLKNSVPAIVDAIKDYLQDPDADITIYEPWKNIFYTTTSELSGVDRLMGDYYRFGVIDVRYHSENTPLEGDISAGVAKVVNEYKSAGITAVYVLGKAMAFADNLSPISGFKKTLNNLNLLDGGDFSEGGHAVLNSPYVSISKEQYYENYLDPFVRYANNIEGTLDFNKYPAFAPNQLLQSKSWDVGWTANLTNWELLTVEGIDAVVLHANAVKAGKQYEIPEISSDEGPYVTVSVVAKGEGTIQFGLAAQLSVQTVTAEYATYMITYSSTDYGDTSEMVFYAGENSDVYLYDPKVEFSEHFTGYSIAPSEDPTFNAVRQFVGTGRTNSDLPKDYVWKALSNESLKVLNSPTSVHGTDWTLKVQRKIENREPVENTYTLSVYIYSLLDNTQYKYWVSDNLYKSITDIQTTSLSKGWNQLTQTFSVAYEGTARFLLVGSGEYYFADYMKLEQGEIATPFSLSAYEDYAGAWGEYVGFATKDSQDPTDYKWLKAKDYYPTAINYE